MERGLTSEVWEGHCCSLTSTVTESGRIGAWHAVCLLEESELEDGGAGAARARRGGTVPACHSWPR